MVSNVFKCDGTCVFDDFDVEKVVENGGDLPFVPSKNPYFFLPPDPVGGHPGTTPPPGGGVGFLPKIGKIVGGHPLDPPGGYVIH